MSPTSPRICPALQHRRLNLWKPQPHQPSKKPYPQKPCLSQWCRHRLKHLQEGRRETTWFAPGVVKYHRTIATTLTEALAAGFRLTAIQEWGPTDAQIAQHPSWADERIRPPFLLVALAK